jgi:acetoin utilization deacetylase AcuC-like enzyme
LPRIVHHPRYTLEWPGHVFPTLKYRRVRERLDEEGIARPEDILEPPGASREQLLLVHTPAYLDRLEAMTQRPELGYYEFEAPCTREVLDAFLFMTGGSILAGRRALEEGVGVNLGGGFHHAFADHGEGFCAINDIAVAIRVLRREGAIERALVVDLDLHQGNGTARIFQGDDAVFTFSIHQENNYPIKERSDLDVGLEDFAGDDVYLAALREHLPSLFERSRPDLAVYVAGADPYEHDQLGGLRLTKAGFAERDRLVLGAARERGVPVLALLAGGYAKNPEDVVDIHVAMVREACRRTEHRAPGGPTGERRSVEGDR